jgi:hypothetical protein
LQKKKKKNKATDSGREERERSDVFLLLLLEFLEFPRGAELSAAVPAFGGRSTVGR